MPTYEYACKSCHEHLEVVQSFQDAPLRECPSCGGELRKVFSAIGISFKGDGFYKTDSRKSGVSSGAKSGADKGGDAGSSSDGAGAGAKASESSSGSTGSSSSSDASSSKAQPAAS